MDNINNTLYLLEQLVLVRKQAEAWARDEGKMLSPDEALVRWIETGKAKEFKEEWNRKNQSVNKQFADILQKDSDLCNTCLQRVAEEYANIYSKEHFPKDTLMILFGVWMGD